MPTETRVTEWRERNAERHREQTRTALRRHRRRRREEQAMVPSQPVRDALLMAEKRFLQYAVRTGHEMQHERRYRALQEGWAREAGISISTASRLIALIRSEELVPRLLADEVAILAGLHPAFVLGPDWDRGSLAAYRVTREGRFLLEVE